MVLDWNWKLQCELVVFDISREIQIDTNDCVCVCVRVHVHMCTFGCIS